MARNAVDFASELTRWGEKVLDPDAFIRDAVQEAAVEIGTKIIDKTPVKTGLAKGNWRLSFSGRVASGVLRRLDPSGETTKAALIASASLLAAHSSFTIYNNVDYVEFLETGSSRQAPGGMIAISIAEFFAETSNINKRLIEKIKLRLAV